MHYWNIEPYLAFGPSAHGFDGKNRWSNIDSLSHYMNTVDSDRSPICNKEHLTEINITNELVGFRMRTTKGLDLTKIPKALREEYRRKVMDVVIWSKANCGYCESAKTMFESRNIAYTENKIGDTHTREQLLEAVPDAKTVPQIFIDGNLIGGYHQLDNYFNPKENTE